MGMELPISLAFSRLHWTVAAPDVDAMGAVEDFLPDPCWGCCCLFEDSLEELALGFEVEAVGFLYGTLGCCSEASSNA